MAVVAAFDLAVEEHGDSASGCLERCEQLRRHIEALQKVRGDDAVVRTHRAAFARLSADAWQRLGDTAESERLLNEAARHLNEAAKKPDADQRDLTKQRAALSEQRMRLAGTERRIAASVREPS
jgi:PHD/YefM family antitoxin component YafN of YafNO toxin-antitoxin module